MLESPIFCEEDRMASFAAMFVAALSLLRAPLIAPVDDTAASIRITHLVPGSRVAVYSGGVFIASGVASQDTARLPIDRELVPGTRLIVVERTGAGVQLAASATVQHDYVTYHYNNRRTGWNPYEHALTTQSVASTSFGMLFTLNLDADVLAQPLYVQNVSIPGMGVHNVLYAATENDSLFAFDADTGASLWEQNYTNPAAGITAVPDKDVGSCPDISPAIGITATPVIDVASGSMFFVTKIKAVSGGIPSWHQMLHKVDITTGLDMPGSPVEIVAQQVIGGGAVVQFDPRWQLNRPSLLLADDIVYLGFGSHCDLHPTTVHGWLLGYSSNGLRQRFAFDPSPNMSEGFASIWSSGFGPSADGLGNVYVVTGNGLFDADSGGSDLGDSVLRLTRDLAVRDYFTPYDQAALDAADLDLGSGGLMLLPPQPGPVPDMAVIAGKGRTLYLLNADNLGKYTNGGPDAVLQAMPGELGKSFGVWGGPAYFVAPSGTPYVYFAGGHDFLKAFALSTSPMPQLTLASSSAQIFVGEGGTIPAVSSNKSAPGSGIVWAVQRPRQSNTAVFLMAFDATDLTKMLFTGFAGTYDHQKGGLFAVPTVIQGKVYVATGPTIGVFGLHAQLLRRRP
jgi:hypothetical protein